MRVKIERIIHPERSLRLLRFQQPAFGNELHRHAHLELTWIERGEGQRFVGNHVGPFSAGDMVLIAPHVPHTWLAAPRADGSPHVATVLQLSAELFDSQGIREFTVLDDLLRMARRGLQIRGPAHALAAQALLDIDAASSGLRRLALVLGLFDQLLAHAAHCVPLAVSEEPGAGGDGERRIDRVVDWIGRQFREPLTAQQGAQLAHVSPGAFSRFFRREVGKGFADFVNDVRCSEACLMLARSERPVAEVAQACGFGTLSNFNRQFLRRHGVSPRTFRKGR